MVVLTHLLRTVNFSTLSVVRLIRDTNLKRTNRCKRFTSLFTQSCVIEMLEGLVSKTYTHKMRRKNKFHCEFHRHNWQRSDNWWTARNARYTKKFAFRIFFIVLQNNNYWHSCQCVNENVIAFVVIFHVVVIVADCPAWKKLVVHAMSTRQWPAQWRY